MILLLSVSPLHNISEQSIDDKEDEAAMEEASKFTANVHYDHICDVFLSFYNISIEGWLANQTADSASANIKL